MMIGDGKRHNGKAHWKMLGRRFFHGGRVQLLVTRSSVTTFSSGWYEFLPSVTLSQLLLQIPPEGAKSIQEQKKKIDENLIISFIIKSNCVEHVLFSPFTGPLSTARALHLGARPCSSAGKWSWEHPARSAQEYSALRSRSQRPIKL